MVKEMGMIERYGTGIKRVRKMFTDYGLLEPRFETIPGGFAVTVFANTENQGDINMVGDDVGDDVGDNVGDSRLMKVMDLIKQNNQISAKQMAIQLSVTDRTIERDIEKLKKQGKLLRIGNEKSGHWEIIINPS